MDALQATVNSFQTRLPSVETTAGENFARLATAEANIEMLQSGNQSLLDRIDDLENRSWSGFFNTPAVYCMFEFVRVGDPTKLFLLLV